MGFQDVTNNTYKETEQAVPAESNYSYGKLLLLGFFAIVLCSFGPMSFFASVPLTMAILIFGRKMVFSMVAVLAIALFTVTINFNLGAYLGFMFLSSYFYAFLLGEIFLRKIHPVRGLLFTGAVVLMLTLVLVIGMVASGVDFTAELSSAVNQTLEVIKQNNSDLLAAKGAEARMLEDILNNPDMIVKKIMNWSPAAIFVSNYFILWACLFVLLRNSLFWRIKHSYPYTIKDISSFKVPEVMIWPFILSLAIAVGGEYVIGSYAEIVGGNLMYCLGIFYFFQGFGIYLDFLTFAKVRGLFRSLLVIFTVSMAWRLIVVVGVFDFWVNFRKYFNKNKEEN